MTNILSYHEFFLHSETSLKYLRIQLFAHLKRQKFFEKASAGNAVECHFLKSGFISQIFHPRKRSL